MSETELAVALREALFEGARKAMPREACGVVLGRGRTPVEIVALSNLARHPEEYYALDPLEYMHAEREAGRRGLDVVGVWHSHPDSAAVPSESDRRAAWPGWLYLIVGSPGSEAEEIRGWRLRGSRFQEESLR